MFKKHQPNFAKISYQTIDTRQQNHKLQLIDHKDAPNRYHNLTEEFDPLALPEPAIKIPQKKSFKQKFKRWLHAK